MIRQSDPMFVYWAQLPFAMINHALQAADWFAQVAPVLVEAAILSVKGRPNHDLRWELPRYCESGPCCDRGQVCDNEGCCGS